MERYVLWYLARQSEKEYFRSAKLNKSTHGPFLDMVSNKTVFKYCKHVVDGLLLRL